jgi:hypothetical protein
VDRGGPEEQSEAHPDGGRRDPPARVETPAAEHRLAGADDQADDRAAGECRQWAVDPTGHGGAGQASEGNTRVAAVQISQVRRNDGADVSERVMMFSSSG